MFGSKHWKYSWDWRWCVHRGNVVIVAKLYKNPYFKGEPETKFYSMPKTTSVEDSSVDEDNEYEPGDVDGEGMESEEKKIWTFVQWLI